MKPSLQWIKDNIDAVLFDLDGTLVDSMWMWHAIDVEYLSRFGLALPDDYQKSIEGLSFHEVAVYTKERFSIPDSLEKMKADWNDMAYDFYKTRVPVKPGVLRFLRFLKDNGIRMGIATSNSRELMDAVMLAQGLMPYFDVRLTGCEVAKGKPSPDIYLAVSERLGVRTDRCLVFEDVEAGMLAGHAAGMPVCIVYDAFSSAMQDSLRANAEFYINSYEEFSYEA